MEDARDAACSLHWKTLRLVTKLVEPRRATSMKFADVGSTGDKFNTVDAPSPNGERQHQPQF